MAHNPSRSNTTPTHTLGPQTLASLESRLVPYFHITHPSRGPLAGPFKKLVYLRADAIASPSRGEGASVGANQSVSGGMWHAAPKTTSRPICVLVLDVIATLLGLDRAMMGSEEEDETNCLSKEGQALKRAVGLVLGGPGSEAEHENIGSGSGGEGDAETPRRRLSLEEADGSMSLARRYWDHVSMMRR